MSRYLTWLLLATMGCEGPAPTLETAYYRLDTALYHQAQLLEAQGVGVTKAAAFGKRVETQRLDSLDWSEEMNLFQEAAINRAAWANSFATDTARTPDGYTLRYTAQESGVPVRWLHVRFGKGHLRQITALIQDKNVLYNSTRQLSLRFEPWRDTVCLESYQIEGFQKMILRDTVRFTIRTEVDLTP